MSPPPDQAVRTKKELLRCKEELMRLRVAESNSADASTVDRLRRTVALVRRPPAAPCQSTPPPGVPRRLTRVSPCRRRPAPSFFQSQNELVRATAAMERLEHELMMERESNKMRPTLEQLSEARAQVASLEEELSASRRFGLTPRPDWTRIRPEPLPGETSASTRAIAEAMSVALERAKNEAVTVRPRDEAALRVPAALSSTSARRLSAVMHALLAPGLTCRHAVRSTESLQARAEKAELEVRFEQLQAQVRELQVQLEKTRPPPAEGEEEEEDAA